ncbi:hypothetical protein CJ199_14235, partial [Brevibacterium paucivorans]
MTQTTHLLFRFKELQRRRHEKNFLNRSIAVACGFVLALSGISAANAGGKLTGYDTTVGKFNGSG